MAAAGHRAAAAPFSCSRIVIAAKAPAETPADSSSRLARGRSFVPLGGRGSSFEEACLRTAPVPTTLSRPLRAALTTDRFAVVGAGPLHRKLAAITFNSTRDAYRVTPRISDQPLKTMRQNDNSPPLPRADALQRSPGGALQLAGQSSLALRPTALT